MLLGLIGDFLGAALGGLVWFGIGLLGFYAWVAAILLLTFFQSFLVTQIFA